VSEERDEMSMKERKTGLSSRGVLLGVGVVVAFWPVWRWYGLRLVDGSDEPWGLLALGLAGVFLWRERDWVRVERRGLLAALLPLGIYVGWYGYLPALVRGLLAVGTVVLMLGMWRRNPGGAGLLVLSLPVMASLQFYAGYPMRVGIAVVSEGVLSLMGLGVTREGVNLLWEGQRVVVDAPCSGVQMLWVGFLMHFALAAWYRLRPGRLFWASMVTGGVLLAANVVRSTGLFFLETGMVSGMPGAHEGMGLLVFAGVLVWMVKLHQGWACGRRWEVSYG
jgi:exosortase/archaeosortase family protein